ncbi:MAG: CYTH domain-containing protein [Candidatus Improbicoccus devescovinae]|nr:MAG: CYTH domain-containing protein [Candidatus Improbicoccus devescovinae]
MLEKEFKCTISALKYKELISEFDWDVTLVLKNHYYLDTENVLLSNKINVRVRETIGQQTVLQVKTPVHNSSGYKVSKEHEEKIENPPFVISGKRIEKITKIEISDVYHFGFLETKRMEFHFDKTNILCLDKSTYLGVIDYEVELEFSGEKVNKNLIKKLESQGVDFDRKAHGKRSRFFKKVRDVLEKY